MKIIDSKKDYYDYLSGIYGIDDKIVFDRRNSSVLKTNEYDVNFGCGLYYFSDERDDDKPRKQEIRWIKDDTKRGWKYKKKKVLVGQLYYFVLEVGYYHYYFEIERYKEDGIFNKNIYLLSEQKVDKKLSDEPLSIIPCYLTIKYSTNTNSWRYYTDRRCDNPILINTFIPKYIPSEDIWNRIYEYLSSLKDIQVNDNRTDEQKLESAGFDKKTSFRNIK